METLGLVDDLGGDPLQGVAVGAGVVGAEHELAAGLQEHLDVRLGAAAVAAIVGREPGGFESEVHAVICSTDPGADGSVHSPGSPGAQSPVSRTAPPRTASGGCAVRGVVRRRIRRVSTTTAAKKSAYDARNLQVLEGLEAVRKRPGKIGRASCRERV